MLRHLLRLLVLIGVPAITACQPDDLPYFPVGANLQWIYDIRVRNWRDVNVQHSREAVRGLPALRANGEWLLRRWRHDDSIAFYRDTERGLLHLGTAPAGSGRTPADIRGQEQLLLPSPLRKGATWVRNGMTFLVPVFACGYCTTTAPIASVIPVKYEVVSTDVTVDVPAGVFEHCIHIAGRGMVYVDSGTGTGWIDLSVDTEEWYAPGVGLVRSRWHEVPHTRMLSDGEFIMELAAVLGNDE